MKLGQLMKYMSKFFIEKYAENVFKKLVPDLYSVLVNTPKYNPCIQETLVNKIF